jgi:sugar phosphate isomerase/epimerase
MTQLALSSYWMREHWKSLGEFFRAGADLGFRSYEVSGLRRDTFYDEIRPGQFHIASFHNPAPRGRGTREALGNAEMRNADVLLASPDNERRMQAVAIAKRCVDIAGEYGAQVIVLHVGQTGADPALAERLGELFRCGDIHSPQADDLRSQLLVQRAQRQEERLAALRRSLDELALYASQRAMRLGIENRPIREMPSFDEVQQIMDWYADGTVGYWHDTGHAQVQEALGFTPHADWLQAFGHRLVGVHLHDVVGLEVHRAPGAGSVDWAVLAPLASAQVPRVVEVGDAVSESDLTGGVRHLHSTGWD